MVEVAALHPQDAENAQAGGADRLHVFRVVGDEMLTLEPSAVSAIVRATDLPVRVTLRLSGGFTTQGGEFSRLAGLVTDYLSQGVEGFVFGFLTPDLEVDVAVCAALAGALASAPWAFDRAFDHALDARRAWRHVRRLPGLDGIHTAGSVLGLASGLEDLLDLAESDPAFAWTAVAAGGLHAEAVPWLVRAGVTKIHLGASVRPGGSWTKAHVDPAFVRSWRLLLDSAVDHQRGLSPQAG
ncbi:MAG: copper homeostasis protein [Nocardioidaceae bacterium]|jgi:copper homeostasis protein|nr:copper homeostasis protein [Nocardioidaceae bacterium]